MIASRTTAPRNEASSDMKSKAPLVIGAPPISYSVNGKQFIAVITGGSRGIGPQFANFQAAAQVVVFAL